VNLLEINGGHLDDLVNIYMESNTHLLREKEDWWKERMIILKNRWFFSVENGI